jgi:hypothetical protein
MDAVNHFESKTTVRLIRLEYLVALGTSFFLLFTHLGKINWWVFAALFVYIDLIGYIPGAIAFHRSKNKRISKAYYVLYNTMHSMVTQSAVALLWVVLVKPEWALLALPIHLCGDRALFGNFLKPFSVSFEPVVHPAFSRLIREIEVPDSSVAPAPSALAGRAVIS